MSFVSDDALPRIAPNLPDNSGIMIVPSVPDVSIIFDQTIQRAFVVQTPTSNLTSADQYRNQQNQLVFPSSYHDLRKNTILKQTGNNIQAQQISTAYNSNIINENKDYKQTLDNKKIQEIIDALRNSSIQNVFSNGIQVEENLIYKPINPSLNSIKSNVSAENENKSIMNNNNDIKEILELLKKNSEQISEVKKSNDCDKLMQQAILQELKECKISISILLKKQENLESTLNEIINDVKQLKLDNQSKKILVSDKSVNTETIQKENLKWTPILQKKNILTTKHQQDIVPFADKTIGSPILDKKLPLMYGPATSTTPLKSYNLNNNGDIKNLFNKYEVQNATTNRRSVDFSVSSLNYLQRHGLLDTTKDD